MSAEEILAELSDLKMMLFERCNRLFALIDNLPTNEKLKYDEIIKAIFSPPKMENGFVNEPIACVSSPYPQAKEEKEEKKSIENNINISNGNHLQNEKSADLRPEIFDSLSVMNVSFDPLLGADFVEEPTASTNKEKSNLDLLLDLQDLNYDQSKNAFSDFSGDKDSLLAPNNNVVNDRTTCNGAINGDLNGNHIVSSNNSLGGDFSNDDKKLILIESSNINSLKSDNQIGLEAKNHRESDLDSIEATRNGSVSSCTEKDTTHSSNSILPNHDSALEYIKVPNYGQFIDIKMVEVHNCRNFFVHLNEAEANRVANLVDTRYKSIANLDPYRLMSNNDSIRFKRYYCAYDQNDERYYRVQVLSRVSLDSFCVHFIDFGQIKDVPRKSLFILDSDSRKYPIMALCCFISDSWIKDCCSVEANFFESMRNISRESLDKLKIRGKFDPPIENRYPVQLMVERDGKWKQLDECRFGSIKDLSVAFKKMLFNFSDFLTLHPSLNFTKSNFDYFCSFFSSLRGNQLSLLEANRPIEVSCPFVYTISKFICIVQSFRDSRTSDPDHFTTNLTMFYEKFAPESAWSENDSPPNTGQLIVFRYDKFYFRGYLMMMAKGADRNESDRRSYQVLSIDFAFFVNVSLADMFPLVELFAIDRYPLFALVCSLDNVMPASNTWSPLAHETFKNWVKRQDKPQQPQRNDQKAKLTLIPKHFLQFTNSIYSVDLRWSCDELSASQMLIKLKYGVSMQSDDETS